MVFEIEIGETVHIVDSSVILGHKAEAQGTSYFLRHTSFRNKGNFQLEGQEDDACNKDTGSVMKLRRWSRGIFAIVRGGGHIEMFAPLFNSESPTQVKYSNIRILNYGRRNF